jgi:hypothetical protein
MTKNLSVRAYARHRGVTHRAVQLAVAAGRITKGRDGLLNPKTADAQWAANTDETKSRHSVSGNPKRRRTPGNPPLPASSDARSPIPTAPSTAETGYIKARAVREGYSARLAKLDFELKSGSVISADVVKVTAFNLARRCRDMLLNIPDRIAPILAGCSDSREVHKLLTEEIQRVCAELGSANGHEPLH